jgi:hypothetical protein
MKNAQKQFNRTEDVVDLGLRCLICRTPLTVPESVAGDVVSVVESGGTALLRCYGCGLIQFIRRKSLRMHD